MTPAGVLPLRVGAIDIGSNAIRLMAAEFRPSGERVELDYVREPVRLGADAFARRELSDATLDRAVATLVGFRRRLDEIGVEHTRAVATSAARESRNGAELVRRAREQAGLRVELITGAEEARLIWLAVRERMQLGRRKWILMDLGGGSVEISLVTSSAIAWSVSHSVGTVRLLEELGDRSASPARFRRLLEEYVATLQLELPRGRRRVRPAGVIATGGNIEALVRLSDPASVGDGVVQLPLAELRASIRTLSGLSVEERMRELDLREDRADVILPAAVIYERIAAAYGAEVILVPQVGLKDGVLVDLVDDLLAHAQHASRHDQDVYAGALELGRRFDFDEAHAVHVAQLAASLYDQLAALHALPARDRRILVAAALLHDIGQFVSYRAHHKHAYYLISHSELPGFSPEQIGLVSLVARYHRKAEPKEEHEGYAELNGDDRERVVKLAALLRVADALDREHVQRVREVKASIANGELRLRIIAAGDQLLERWAIDKKGKLLERTFGVTMRLEQENGDD